jgi:hypothetical protein
VVIDFVRAGIGGNIPFSDEPVKTYSTSFHPNITTPPYRQYHRRETVILWVPPTILPMMVWRDLENVFYSP